ncbi:MAG: hypothetical protein HFJ75_00355 [Eggerthellaceae bacterium]|nr:hypothetical protein [Eggerthellaceae bacterium]
MDIDALRTAVDAAPLRDRAALEKLVLYVSAGGRVLPEYEEKLGAAEGYQDFLRAIYEDPALKDTLVWAECARLSRRNWLPYFEPSLAVCNLRLKTDGIPVQMGDAVMLAPTGSRDNIANLYVFPHGGFNRQAAEFVTSLGGRFTVADWEFLGVYGLYKYRGTVILEEWDVERPPVASPQR